MWEITDLLSIAQGNIVIKLVNSFFILLVSDGWFLRSVKVENSIAVHESYLHRYRKTWLAIIMITRISSLTCLFWSLKNSPLFSITCSSVNWAYGCSLHRVRISHRVTPNAHTSLAMVNLPCGNTHGQTDVSLRCRILDSISLTRRMLSQDIQRMGSTARPCMR